MAANNIDHFRYQNNGCEKKKIKKFQEWDLLANYLSLKLKWIVVLRNILQIKLWTCNMLYWFNKYYYIKKVCFDDRKHVLLHCQFTSLYAKEWVKWTTNYMRKTKQEIVYWYKQYRYIHVGTCDLHVVSSVNILSLVLCN